MKIKATMSTADTVEPISLKFERQMSFQNTSSNAGEHKVRRARKRGSEVESSPRCPSPGAGRGWDATLLDSVLMLLAMREAWGLGAQLPLAPNPVSSVSQGQ